MTKRLMELLKRKQEIRTQLQDEKSQVDFEKVTKELDDLENEERSIRQRLDLISKMGTDSGAKEIENPGKAEERKVLDADAEKRGIDLRERRAITVGSSSIVVAKHSATDLKPTFNEISSLVDAVTIKPLLGGESYERGYVDSYGEGGETDASGNYKDVETKFGYVSINKQKITAYQEEPEEVSKLAPAAYSQEIINGTSIAVRKRLAKDILVGDGSAGHLVGIFDTKATAISAATDLEIAAIDENTLDTIVYGYGGDENVEDTAVLILNKKDLAAFAKIKGADKKKAYDIKHNGNKGTINDVPFIINSACKALSDSNVTAGAYCMAYGVLSNYELAVFSDLEVQRSDDYKFKQGQIAHRGSIFAGGNVAAKNGFLRIKKKAQA